MAVCSFQNALFAGGHRSAPTPTPSHDPKQEHMVSLLEDMLALHKELAAAHTPQEQKALQRQIDTTDRQIDQLVYALYGLTEEEIGIVEG